MFAYCTLLSPKEKRKKKKKEAETSIFRAVLEKNGINLWEIHVKELILN